VSNIEYRTAGGLEVRDDGRTLVGLAVPYNTPTRIGSYVEEFTRGAFATADPTRVPVLAQHDHQSLPIGRALSLTETDQGLSVELHVSDTQFGNDVLTLVRDGALTGLSIGFRPVRDQWNPTHDHVVRQLVDLVEVSAVPFPAYDTARIAAVRSEGSTPTPRLTIARFLNP
jgi:HK97 family phage prohead protease